MTPSKSFRSTISLSEDTLTRMTGIVHDIAHVGFSGSEEKLQYFADATLKIIRHFGTGGAFVDQGRRLIFRKDAYYLRSPPGQPFKEGQLLSISHFDQPTPYFQAETIDGKISGRAFHYHPDYVWVGRVHELYQQARLMEPREKPPENG